jgi:hypothetical protein
MTRPPQSQRPRCPGQLRLCNHCPHYLYSPTMLQSLIIWSPSSGLHHPGLLKQVFAGLGGVATGCRRWKVGSWRVLISTAAGGGVRRHVEFRGDDARGRLVHALRRLSTSAKPADEVTSATGRTLTLTHGYVHSPVAGSGTHHEEQLISGVWKRYVYRTTTNSKKSGKLSGYLR